MSKKHWGEIPLKRRHEQVVPNIMADIERCMDQFSLAEYQDETDTELTENIVCVEFWTVFISFTSTFLFIVYLRWIQ